MAMMQVERVMDVLVEEVPTLLANRGISADSCVLATRVVCLALGEIGVKASPLPVAFSGYSPRYVQAARNGEVKFENGETVPQDVQDRLAAEGAWNIRIGHGYGPGERRLRFDGHLVALVERRWVLDLTIHQATRPQKGMFFAPHHFRVTRTFMAGDVLALMMGESVGIYQRIEANTYLVSADWTKVRRDESMVRSAVRAMRASTTATTAR